MDERRGKRVAIIGVILVFSFIILSHELGHFLMAKKMGVRVEVFSFGFGPKIMSIKKRDTEYVISAIPLGGYVKMAGEEPGDLKTGSEWEFSSKPVYKRFNIVFAGALVNYLTGFLLFSIIFMAGAPVATSRIGEILDGYPAGKAGIRKDDKILSINGTATKNWQNVIDGIHGRSSGESIAIELMRDGQVLSFDIRGEESEQKDIFGKPVKVTLIGIAPSDEVEYVKYGIFDSIAKGADTTWRITTLTYSALWNILTGSLSVKTVSGPIGIFAMTGKFAKMGIIHLLWITAVISVSLALFNLLPLPILDGGHILFLIFEKIKGRPIEKKIQEVVQQVALVLLITFVLVVSWNDIMKFF